jgi:zinc protease
VNRAPWALCALLLAACGHPTPAAPHVAPRPTPSAARDAEPWRTAVPAPAAPRSAPYPAPELHQLPSGLRVYLVRRSAGVVSLSVVAKAGVLPPKQSGLAALTARMLTESTQHKRSLELAEAVEALGSSLEHDTGRDYSRVSLLVLPQDLDAGLGLLAEVVREPAFAPDEFARVQKEWLDGLRAERQTPMRLASLAGLRLLLGPELGAPVSGGISDVEHLSVRDLRDYHARAFVPGNCALLVVGDVGWADVEALVQKRFGTWHGAVVPSASTAVVPPAPAATRIVLVDRPDAVQSAVFVAQPLPARLAKGHEAREVLSALLGGLFTSRLNRNLREQHGYTYGIQSRAIATARWGALAISSQIKTEDTPAALRELQTELRQAQDPALGRPIDAQETDRAKADLVSALGAHLQSVESVAADTALLFVESLPADYYAGYATLVARVTPADAQAQAREQLVPERLIGVVVGDRSTVEAGLRAGGGSVELAPPDLTE